MYRSISSEVYLFIFYLLSCFSVIFLIVIPSTHQTCSARFNLFLTKKCCKLGLLHSCHRFSFIPLSILSKSPLHTGPCILLNIFFSKLCSFSSSPRILDHISHAYDGYRRIYGSHVCTVKVLFCMSR